MKDDVQRQYEGISPPMDRDDSDGLVGVLASNGDHLAACNVGQLTIPIQKSSAGVPPTATELHQPIYPSN